MIDFTGLIGLTVKGKAYSGGTGEVQGQVVGVSFKGEKYDQPLVWLIAANNAVVGVLLPGIEVVRLAA